jgi:hypothetical protein
MTMLCGVNGIMRSVPQIRIVLSVPQDIVMDLNHVMSFA